MRFSMRSHSLYRLLESFCRAECETRERGWGVEVLRGAHLPAGLVADEALAQRGDDRHDRVVISDLGATIGDADEFRNHLPALVLRGDRELTRYPGRDAVEALDEEEQERTHLRKVRLRPADAQPLLGRHLTEVVAIAGGERLVDVSDQ